MGNRTTVLQNSKVISCNFIHPFFCETNVYIFTIIKFALTLYEKLCLKNFFYSTASRLDSGFTQPTIQWVLGAFSLGVKWLRCEAYHLPPFSVNSAGAVPPLPHKSSLCGAKLNVYRDNLTFTFPCSKRFQINHTTY
jgi:hypothetical protein